MTTDNKYNGWTNYATWRVNLEIFDNMELGDFWSYADEKPSDINAYDFGQELKEYAEDLISTDCSTESFAFSYALAFISDVNWTEIAQSLIDNQE